MHASVRTKRFSKITRLEREWDFAGITTGVQTSYIIILYSYVQYTYYIISRRTQWFYIRGPYKTRHLHMECERYYYWYQNDLSQYNVGRSFYNILQSAVIGHQSPSISILLSIIMTDDCPDAIVLAPRRDYIIILLTHSSLLPIRDHNNDDTRNHQRA